MQQRHSNWTRRVLLLFILCAAHAADTTQRCKCVCDGKVTILTVSACNFCSKNFCVEQGACYRPPPEPTPTTTATATGTTTSSAAPEQTHTEENWTSECFQLGSWKDEIIIYSFMVMLIGLLVFAAAKDKLFKVRSSDSQLYMA
ncbi:uncharacterized protein EV422DRAFT_212463 [Fimicolochytrium jonesii]|uniref:uncharacterized protein n=1 Tax=Fimicolochytrium jonesii TaxID=1396493 RepID=UPI0022FF281C|nr:uncharacterized protein EV422DRAFT_212463 [Fimicolochytrium jonesii]KAI8817693.1 hypothetical protein EV422DRAFT_212463 [Fimicolochytrium jonesii]